MNLITERIRIGTVGELLVQLRLLEHKIQAAPPIKDSGNDLIAVRGEVFRAIQVKTTKGKRYSKARLPEKYHILAVVQLIGGEESVYLDKSPIFLIPQEEVHDAPASISRLERYRMTYNHVNALFQQ
jgi:hypothetical protein